MSTSLQPTASCARTAISCGGSRCHPRRRGRLLALRNHSGEPAWEQPRALFKAGWSTPMIFRHGAAEDLIVLGSRRLTAYDPATGQERWWAGGFPEETVGVPVAADGLLFASGAAMSRPTLLALRPGASGDARPTHVAWELRRGIPVTSSLLCIAGRLYLMRDGGLLTCLEAATGRELFRERIGAPGQYIASPIAVGDRLVVASTQGVVTIIQTADTLRVLAGNGWLGMNHFPFP